MYVDLHIHTVSSDGTWEKEELIEKLIESNITLFSVTDHDIVGSGKSIDCQLKRPGLRFLMGVEISCTYEKEEYHITAYSFDPDDGSLRKLLEENRDIRYENINHSIKLLETINPKISYSHYQSYQYEKKRGGWKSLNFMLDEGIVKNLSDYFGLLDEVGNEFIFAHPVTVIETVKKAGGTPFLAHPSAYFEGRIMPLSELKRWIDFGISGIECYSSYIRNRQDVGYYVSFCKKNGLLISGGSDCHGEFALATRKLGHPRISLDMLNLGYLI